MAAWINTNSDHTVEGTRVGVCLHTDKHFKTNPGVLEDHTRGLSLNFLLKYLPTRAAAAERERGGMQTSMHLEAQRQWWTTTRDTELRL